MANNKIEFEKDTGMTKSQVAYGLQKMQLTTEYFLNTFLDIIDECQKMGLLDLPHEIYDNNEKIAKLGQRIAQLKKMQFSDWKKRDLVWTYYENNAENVLSFNDLLEYFTHDLKLTPTQLSQILAVAETPLTNLNEIVQPAYSYLTEEASPYGTLLKEEHNDLNAIADYKENNSAFHPKVQKEQNLQVENLTQEISDEDLAEFTSIYEKAL